MAKIVITKDNLLALNEFKALLEQTSERSSILDDVLGLLRDLVAFEDKYKMSSDVFYARFMRGEMGDDLDYIMWAGVYESYLEAKQDIINQLEQVTIPA